MPDARARPPSAVCDRGHAASADVSSKSKLSSEPSTSPAARLRRAGGLRSNWAAPPTLYWIAPIPDLWPRFPPSTRSGWPDGLSFPRSSRRNAPRGPKSSRSRNLRFAAIPRGAVLSCYPRGRRGGFAAPGAVATGLCYGPELARRIEAAGRGLGGFGRTPSSQQDAAREFDGWLDSCADGTTAPAAAKTAYPAATTTGKSGSASKAQTAPAAAIADCSSYMPLAACDQAALSRWTKGKLDLRCVRTVPETHDVRTFRFVALDPVLFSHKPGQFMTLDLAIDGKKVRRSYTISSPPSRPHTVEITVKRVPGGLVSNWLHDNLEPGDVIRVIGPSGHFNCFDLPAPKVLLLSAGSGITPCMSMARWMHDTGSDCDIVFFHCSRSPSDIIFQRECEIMDAHSANFRFAVSCTRAVPGDPWLGYTGRLDPPMLESICADFRERTIYTCGPEPFMESTRDMLEGLDFPMDRYNEESFGGAAKGKKKPPAPAPAASESAASKSTANESTASESTKSEPGAVAAIKVRFEQLGKEIDVPADEFILDAAEDNGLELESSCRQGTCGTCKARKISGNTEAESTEGLTEEEIEEGFVLLCSARAAGPVVLDL